MKSLIIDHGNTRIKWGLFEHRVLLKTGIASKSEDLFKALTNIQFDYAAYASSGINSFEQFSSYFNDLVLITPSIKTPLTIQYQSIESLGVDRLANAVYAFTAHRNHSNLIIDFGTCITYDVVDAQGCYPGGYITPGAQMRMDAMHEKTAALPLLKIDGPVVPGKTTSESMSSGVYLGIIGEINEIISRLEPVFGPMNILMTGGDFSHFDKAIKYPTFADSNLTLKGLNDILLFQIG